MLRNYQTEAVSQIKNLWASGKKRVMYQLPTGGGKTTVFSHIAREVTSHGIPVLAVVHRIELIKQIFNRFQTFDITASLIASGVKPDYSNPVQIASIQTLNRRNFPNAGLIIIDEAHHSKADSYKTLFKHYPNSLFLGVTATPIRQDGLGFELLDKETKMFDELVTSPQPYWFVENNFLSDCDQLLGKKIDLDERQIKKGEYDTKYLMDIRNDITDPIESYKINAMGKKCITFCISVEHSKEIAKRYELAGIASAHVDGTTPERERANIMSKFKSGEINVLCNVDIVSEGFDVPDCEVVQMLRPVNSLSLYLQQGGRALRPSEGKRAIILDNACNGLKHGHILKDRTWSLDGECEIVKGKKTKRKPKEKEENNTFEVPTGNLHGEMALLNPKTIIADEFENALSEITQICVQRSYKPTSVWYKISEMGLVKSIEHINKVAGVMAELGYKGETADKFWYYRKKDLLAKQA